MTHSHLQSSTNRGGRPTISHSTYREKVPQNYVPLNVSMAADPRETPSLKQIVCELHGLSYVRMLPPLVSPYSRKPSPRDLFLPNAYTFGFIKPPNRVFKFVQPGTQSDFFRRLHKQKVILESTKSEGLAVHGVVRVVNLDYAKDICMIWTRDNWETIKETPCSHYRTSRDEGTARFSFTLRADRDNIEFAIRYICAGKKYWDNNGGENYVVVVQQ